MTFFFFFFCAAAQIIMLYTIKTFNIYCILLYTINAIKTYKQYLQNILQNYIRVWMGFTD